MLEADYDRDGQPLGTIDDISGMDCEAMAPGAIRPDIHGVIQRRSAAQHYTWLADRARALFEELKLETARPPEYYAAQRSLLFAADYLRDAAARMEGSTND